MAANVSAEGEVVATTTSNHFADSTTDDVRKVNHKDPVPLFNWQCTDKLGDKKSEHTQFGGGWVWITPTLLGPPSEPQDTWEGTKNGGKVNAEIKAKDGEGAAHVFVEKGHVLRHNDLTWQNAKNSEGIIHDEDEHKKWLIEAQKRADEALGKGKKAKPKAKAKAKPKPQQTGGTQAPATTGTTNKKVEPCTIESASIKDPRGRESGVDPSGSYGPHTDANHGILEIVGTQQGWWGKSSPITCECDVKEPDGKHPTWESETGWSATGKEAKMEVPSSLLGFIGGTGSSFTGQNTRNDYGTTRAILALPQAIAGAYVPPREIKITVKACNNQFQRTLRVFSAKEFNFSLEFKEGREIFEKFCEKMKSWGLADESTLQITFGAGAIEVKAAWEVIPEEEHSWRAHYGLSIAGKMELLNVMWKPRISILDLTIPGPIGAVQYAIKTVNRAYHLFHPGGGDPVNAYIGFILGLKIGIGPLIKAEKKWEEGWECPKLGLGFDATATLGVYFRVEALNNLAYGEASASTTLGLSAELTTPANEFKFEFEIWAEWHPLILAVVIAVDCALLKGSKGGQVQFGETRKFPLGKLPKH